MALVQGTLGANLLQGNVVLNSAQDSALGRKLEDTVSLDADWNGV